MTRFGRRATTRFRPGLKEIEARAHYARAVKRLERQENLPEQPSPWQVEAGELLADSE